MVTAAILLFFLIFNAASVRAFFTTLSHILRPIFMGMILAFLLLPIQRHILQFMLAMTPNQKLKNKNDVRFLSIISIVLSLLVAFILLYLLLAMVIPQVYDSIVGLVMAFPEYIESAQVWLLTFLEDNPEIQSAIMPIYNSAATSLEQWLSSDILPNLESVSSTLDWLRATVLPNITGVVSGVSAILLAALLLIKDLLIAIIVSVYLLVRKDTFAAQSKKIVYSIFRTDHADLIVSETREVYRIMSGFING